MISKLIFKIYLIFLMLAPEFCLTLLFKQHFLICYFIPSTYVNDLLFVPLVITSNSTDVLGSLILRKGISHSL